MLYQITILGEAVKRLSQAYRQSHSEIEWKAIAGMRDTVFKNPEVNLPGAIAIVEGALYFGLNHHAQSDLGSRYRLSATHA